MSGKGKGSSANDQVIQERRLRPAYDFLDRGNNKRVIQETDRLLKKQPDFQCAKALKALALLRSGHVAECKTIVDALVAEVPTEDNTIQALTICFRELGEPKMVCTILENASKVDKSEEMLSSCFMAHVRVSDFQKQYQVALNLYKLHPKSPYFTWAVMSLFVKAEFDPDPSSRISLPLAEKMMGKFFEEKNHIDSEHEITLHILLLQRLKNYKKILTIIDKLADYKTPVLTGLYHKLKGECIQMTEDSKTTAAYLEDTILKNLGEWSYYESYIKHVGLSDHTRALEFLDSLDKFLPGPPVTSRAILLAPLHLFSFLVKNNFTEVFDPLGYFRKYLFYYGRLPSYFADIESFLGSATDPIMRHRILMVVQDDLTKHREEFKVYAMLQPQHANDTQGLVNSFLTDRYFESVWLTEKSNRQQQDSTVMSNVIYYVTQYLKVAEEQPELRLKEDPSDFFINIACLTLIDKFWSLDSDWTWKLTPPDLVDYRFAPPGYVNPNEPTAKFTNVSHSESDEVKTELKDSTACDQLINGGISILNIENEPPFVPNQRDVAPLLVLSLLHYCLHKSPKNYQTRLLLGKMYMRCGAVAAGTTVLEPLDFKHLMLMSTSYLYTFKLIASANYEEAYRSLTSIELFLSTFEKEGMEHVLSAYKYGSWEKILEFIKFHDHLLKSLLRPLVNVERMLLEYNTEGATGHFSPYPKTQQVTRKMEIEPEILNNLNQLTDSRDFELIDTYVVRPKKEHWKQKSFEAEKLKLRVRYLLLTLLNNASLMSERAKAQEPYDEQLAKMDTFLNLIEEAMEEDTSGLEMNDATIDVMWPSEISQYVKGPCLKYLVALFRVIIQLGKNQTNVDFPQAISQLQECVDAVIGSPKFANFEQTVTILDVGYILETLTQLMETLSFSCLLLDLISVVVRNIAAKKSKKKRSKPPAEGEYAGEAQVLALLNSTCKGFKSIESFLQTFHGTMKDKYPTNWGKMAASWKAQIQIPNAPALHDKVLPYSLPLCISILRSSYGKTTSTLSYQLHSKVCYLEKVISTFDTPGTADTL